MCILYVLFPVVNIMHIKQQANISKLTSAWKTHTGFGCSVCFASIVNPS